ncbi:DUF3124 domain-containing protein [Microcoleus sp. FACHB-672]|uniref:DUF3124 domain-containing protein n=1 Tax=Microcoleus sp. FACHB-672 TaxID=2692825 RepID=UPI001684E6D7|nr:DUF3124 domain-containing protein [Microcoleus sp. FACHB-672]MBD2040054.1 DUF3124 domain-containing protein [Microcoleus sp. FACHB-672]
MKRFLTFLVLIFVVLLSSCNSLNISTKQATNPDNSTQSQLQIVTLDENIKIAAGETLYVPVYSHIYYEDQHKVLNLAATLSLRNTDFINPIIITSVQYYDSNGKLVKQYLEKPIQLNAMASTDFVVRRTDTTGGVGANFIVEWIAEKEVSGPVIEAVMIGAESTQGISFVSSGRVIKTQKNSKLYPPKDNS